jgi:hypothetical protein
MPSRAFALLITLIVAFGRPVDGATESKPAERSGIVTLDTPRSFPTVESKKAWEARAQEIRQQVLISSGLWPMPEKQPLEAHIFGRIERDGYSVEKVYFQTYPGFYLGGNLYRPLGRGKGPFPAILNPHGHWSDGRLADTKDGSIAARCITFARQGWIAFSYDMVGFNDTFFLDQPKVGPDKFYTRHRDFATNEVNQLWNINLLGLQTWDSVRALDFLESLPGVDHHRLVCTGESGGGTQTYLLGAVDRRLTAQVPVVMVSHTMQGGCGCENAPGLRVKYSNMEIAAVAVPRPQMLVAATGDWTRATLTVEGPAIHHIYDLFGAGDSFHYVRFDYNHNYNRTSREAVYAWLGHRYLPRLDADALMEQSYQKEPDAALRVFPNGKLPATAVTRDQLIEFLKNSRRQQLQALAPTGRSTLRKFKTAMFPAWSHTLQLNWPIPVPNANCTELQNSTGLARARLTVESNGHSFEAIYNSPENIISKRTPQIVVLASMNRPGANSTNPSDRAAKWLQRGFATLELDCSSEHAAGDPFSNFFTTYNRTTLQRRVDDLVALCAAARAADPRISARFRVLLCGEGAAGLYALLAAPAADAVIADCNGIDLEDESLLLEEDYFCPGLLAMGGFGTPAILAAPHPLLLHHVSPKFETRTIETAYGHSSIFRYEREKLSDEAIAQWALTAR